MNGLFFRDVEFSDVVQEHVRLWTWNLHNSTDKGRGGTRRGTNGCPVAWTRMLVGMTSNLVTCEALVVAHVLSMLGRGESDHIHVHGIGVTVEGKKGSVSS